MSALTIIIDAGIKALIEPPNRLRLKGLSQLTADQKNQIIEYARNHKPAILAALAQAGSPGECEACPAAGYWDSPTYAGRGLVCFHRAYFLHKAGTPALCREVHAACPRLPG